MIVSRIDYSGNRITNYTEHDVEVLRKLVILTKAGLTCGDIKKVQDGEWTLIESLVKRRSSI